MPVMAVYRIYKSYRLLINYKIIFFDDFNARAVHKRDIQNEVIIYEFCNMVLELCNI